MRIHPIPITILLCFFSIISFSQKDSVTALQLRSGKFFTEKNITAENVKSFTERLQKINGKSFAVLQFDNCLQKKGKKNWHLPVFNCWNTFRQMHIQFASQKILIIQF